MLEFGEFQLKHIEAQASSAKMTRSWITACVLGPSLSTVIALGLMSGCPIPLGAVHLTVATGHGHPRDIKSPVSALQCLEPAFTISIDAPPPRIAADSIIEIDIETDTWTAPGESCRCALNGRPERRRIFLRPVRPDYKLHTLAHEFGHHRLGHVCQKWGSLLVWANLHADIFIVPVR